MPKINIIKIIRDFLIIIKGVNSYFLTIYNVIFNRIEFIKLFKQFYRFNYIRKKIIKLY